MNRAIIASFAILLTSLFATSQASAHCQVPCGIYGDETRFVELQEHVTTIEKAMKQITELSAQGDKNYNQIVRWVNNKEIHADKLTDIVTYYFLAQRVKVPAANDKAAVAKYQAHLAHLHQLMVSAMKAKQTTDQAHVAKLRETIDAYHALYFGKVNPHDHKH